MPTIWMRPIKVFCDYCGRDTDKPVKIYYGVPKESDYELACRHCGTLSNKVEWTPIVVSKGII